MKQKLPSNRIRLFLVMLIIVFAAAMVVGVFIVSGPIAEYLEGAQAYGTLRQYLHVPPEHQSLQDPLSSNADNAPQTEGTENLLQTDPANRPSADFPSLCNINTDTAAWLICENTKINYPVVQGADNSYYLRHLLDGTRNNAGCLFIDCNNTPGFADHNTVIYGHNMADKSMFATLMEYKKQDFFDAHPQMMLLTPAGDYTIDLFAGYVADLKSGSWNLQFSDEAAFAQWLETSRKKSTFASPVQVSTADRFVTLSTCTYEFDNARYVVIGKLSPMDKDETQNSP